MKLFFILSSIFIVGGVCVTIEYTAKDMLDLTVSMFWERMSPPIQRMVKDTINIERSTDPGLSQKCSHSSNDYLETVNSIVQCLNNTDRNISVCTILKAHSMGCYTPFINLTENCMTEKLKGLPTFIAKSTISTISHFCSLTGEQMFEFFNECTYVSDSGESDRKPIIKELQGKMDKIRTDLSIKNICSTGPEIKNLVKQLLEKSCPNRMTHSVYLGVGDAILKPCTVINEA